MLKKIVALCLFAGHFAIANPFKDACELIQDNLCEQGPIAYYITRQLRKLNKKIDPDNPPLSSINWATLIDFLILDTNRMSTVDDAICVAAYRGFNNIIAALLAKRKQPVLQGSDPRMWRQNIDELEDALLICCHRGNETGAVLLLENSEVTASKQMIDGSTPLSYALQKNMQKCTALLIGSDQGDGVSY